MQTLMTGACILFINFIAGRNGHKASGDLDNQSQNLPEVLTNGMTDVMYKLKK